MGHHFIESGATLVMGKGRTDRVGHRSRIAETEYGRFGTLLAFSLSIAINATYRQHRALEVRHHRGNIQATCR